MNSSQNTQNSSSYSFVTPIKLDQNNFIMWHTQILTSIIGNGLESFINDHSVCSKQILPQPATGSSSSSGFASREVNLNFTT